jgi:polyisoprenoid-binding protein YceI
MKKITWVLAIAALAIFTACGGETPPADTPEGGEENVDAGTTESTTTTYTVDAERSMVNWKGTMLKAYSHEGTINIIDGNLTVTDGVITAGTVSVNMSSMSPTDENYNPDAGQTQDALIGHLQSPDFFDVANHPTATYTVTDGQEGIALGDLTVRGNTNPAKIADIKILEADGGVTVSGTLKFDRQQFDVSYANTASDMVLGDEIEMTFKMVGK